MARFQIRPTVDGCYCWRLLGDNNRTLATSAMGFANRDACAEHVVVTLQVARSQVPLVHERGSRRWGWVLTDDQGSEVAHSFAEYARLADCVNAINRFAELTNRPWPPISTAADN
jgi:uncharacterized protein YegP (UPF0339 family)